MYIPMSLNGAYYFKFLSYTQFFCIILYFTVVLYVSTCCDALYLITPIETVTDGIVNEQVCPQPRSYYSSQERIESLTLAEWE